MGNVWSGTATFDALVVHGVMTLRPTVSVLAALSAVTLTACGDPLGLQATDAPVITLGESVYEVERGREFVAFYTVVNPGSRPIVLPMSYNVGVDRLTSGSWTPVHDPDGTRSSSEPPIVLEAQSTLSSMFSAPRPGGWNDGTYRLRLHEILVEPGDGGSGTTVNLPEEWRVSAPFQIRRR